MGKLSSLVLVTAWDKCIRNRPAFARISQKARTGAVMYLGSGQSAEKWKFRCNSLNNSSW